MLIKVKTLTGKEIELDIEPTDKVERIKEKVIFFFSFISSHFSLPSFNGRFWCFGVTMGYIPYSVPLNNGAQVLSNCCNRQCGFHLLSTRYNFTPLTIVVAGNFSLFLTCPSNTLFRLKKKKVYLPRNSG